MPQMRPNPYPVAYVCLDCGGDAFKSGVDVSKKRGIEGGVICTACAQKLKSSMPQKKLPPLTEAAINYIEEMALKGIVVPSDMHRLCAQAKRYPAMVEALEELRDQKRGESQLCLLHQDLIQAALKGETPQ